MKRQRWMAACVILAMVCMPLAAARAQVLKQVPADAMIVIRTGNLKDASDKIAKMANKFGVAQFNPALSNPLANLKQYTGMANGLNEAGDAAVVILAPAKPAKRGEVIVLLPVSDYKVFVANYPAAQTEGDITQINFPKNNKARFAAQWGAYAAVTETREALAQKPEGITPSGAVAKEIEGRDFVIYANMKAIRERAIPELKANRDKARAQMLANMKKQGNDPKYQNLANTAFDEVMDGVEQFLQQSSGATVGVSLTDAGITSTTLVEFDPNSSWGQSIAAVKNTDQPLISGLPEGKYLMVGGIQGDPQAFTKIFDDVTAPVKKEFVNLGDQGKVIQEFLDSYRAMIQANQSSSFAMPVPTGALGQEAIFQMVSVMRGDAKAMIESQRKLFNSQQALMDAMTQTKAKVTTSYTANAKTVDGVQLNAFQTQFTTQGNTQQEMQMAQMMSMMYGPNGMNGVSGALDDKTAIVATGVSDAMLAKLIASAKAGGEEAGKSPQMQQVAAALPKQRVAMVFIPLDQWVTTAATYAKQFGMPVNVQLPQQLPPVGITAGTEGSAIRVDGMIPAQLVQSLIAAGMQTFAQMRGGQQQAPPEAPAPPQ